MKTQIHNYTDEQIEFVRVNIKGTPYKKMWKMFNERFGTNLTYTQITGFLKRNNLTNGNDMRFEKGQKAWNKDMKGLRTGGEKGWFKKGQTPLNHRTVGSERVNVDDYVEIKVAEPNIWKLKHRVVWQKENGPIPKSHAVIFGDGNRKNFDLDNLILVSRAQLARLNQNGLIQNHAELTRTGVIIADLMQKMVDRKKA